MNFNFFVAVKRIYNQNIEVNENITKEKKNYCLFKIKIYNQPIIEQSITLSTCIIGINLSLLWNDIWFINCLIMLALHNIKTFLA